ncbi:MULTISPECIES: DUF6414 family protein [Comamonas]|uniref:DUF6414 family protein n=1 Tax=Comamonas TaxID=283 RepID=UPI0006B9B729|nr:MULTISPECIES: hypothetical protein [Comamonas]
MKNIIYLDEGKLFSLSSQLFAGATEYIVKEESKETEDRTEQKGPIASGQVLADALKFGERTVEKRVLHDFAYARFEDELISSQRVAEIDKSISDPQTLSGMTRSFVKIKAKAEFFDARKISELFSSFNKLGAAINYTQVFSATETLRASFDERIATAKNKAEAGKLKQEKKNQIDSLVAISNPELNQDERFLESVAQVTDYGYAGLFEVFQNVSGYTYSSILKQEYFREPSDLIVRKYSRSTNAELVVLGVVTQLGALPDEDQVDLINTPIQEPENLSMRNAIMNLSRHMGGIERTLTGKEKFEVVLDPIAAYVLI